jgi:5-methylthioribose kinase
MAKTKGFLDWYMAGLLAEAAGTCGAELSRRTIGLSYIFDIVNIKDETRRARAERLMLRLAKYLILNRASIKTGDAYIEALTQAESAE